MPKACPYAWAKSKYCQIADNKNDKIQIILTTMKKIILAALMSVVTMSMAAQVVAEESEATNKQVLDNYKFEQEGSFGYGLYAGAGYSVTTPSLNDNFGGNFLFQIGAVGTYDGFQLKTDVQFGQPGYRNDNIFGAPAYDEQGHPSQVNGNSSASFWAGACSWVIRCIRVADSPLRLMWVSTTPNTVGTSTT